MKTKKSPVIEASAASSADVRLVASLFPPSDFSGYCHTSVLIRRKLYVFSQFFALPSVRDSSRFTVSGPHGLDPWTSATFSHFLVFLLF